MSHFDDENSRIPNEISDYPVSPFEGMSPGIENAVKRVVSAPFHVAGKIAGTGLHITSRILGKFF